MESFSIWHLFFPLVFFSPFIIGTLVMGWQRKIMIKHTQSQLVKQGAVGWSWTYQLFGCFVPIFRGEIGIGLLHLVFTFITCGIFQTIMAFLYNKQYMSRMLMNGWQLADTEANEKIARKKLGMLAA